MLQSVYERDLFIFSRAYGPEDAKCLAGLMGVARRIDARLRSEGKPGLFSRTDSTKQAQQ